MPISFAEGVQSKVPVTGVQTHEEVKVAPGIDVDTLEFMVMLSPLASVETILKFKLSPGHTSIVAVSVNVPPDKLEIGGELKSGC